MMKDFIIDNDMNIIYEVEYTFYREFHYKNKLYLHYVGNLLNTINSLKKLDSLLQEKREMINEGIFFISHINEEIDKFNLKLKNSNQFIFNLYVENKDIDFYILSDK